jgi:hypothetical protein
MIKVQSPKVLLLSPAGNVTTRPTSCTDPHRVTDQTADRNQRYQDGGEPPFQGNTLLRGFSLGYDTVQYVQVSEVVSWCLASSTAGVCPTAGLSRG